MAARVPTPSLRAWWLAAAAALVLAGCGTTKLETSHSFEPRSPAALHSIQSEGDQLLPGGLPRFQARIDQLHGYPVVVNFWAGWCASCLNEIPIFEEVSPRFASRIAFLGVNAFDSVSGAKGLLAEAHLGYPSYSDAKGEIAAAVGLVRALPDTAFLGPEGKLRYMHYGPYTTASELEADLRSMLQGRLESS